MSVAIDATIDLLLDYIERKRVVSFDDIHEFLLRRLRFNMPTNPISALDVAAYETGRIDVDYDQQLVYSRAAKGSSPRPAATATPIMRPS